MVTPTDVSELRALLGTYNYYRKFIKNFARKAAPLNRLLQNDVPWEWSEPCQEAFESLKVSMTEAPILRRPDINLPFERHTDWSAVGLGAVLIQIDNNGKGSVRCSILSSHPASILHLSEFSISPSRSRACSLRFSNAASASLFSPLNASNLPVVSSSFTFSSSTCLSFSKLESRSLYSVKALLSVAIELLTADLAILLDFHCPLHLFETPLVVPVAGLLVRVASNLLRHLLIPLVQHSPFEAS
jgi:hypothetical protein